MHYPPRGPIWKEGNEKWEDRIEVQNANNLYDWAWNDFPSRPRFLFTEHTQHLDGKRLSSHACHIITILLSRHTFIRSKFVLNTLALHMVASLFSFFFSISDCIWRLLTLREDWRPSYWWMLWTFSMVEAGTGGVGLFPWMERVITLRGPRECGRSIEERYMAFDGHLCTIMREYLVKAWSTPSSQMRGSQMMQ